MNSRKYIIVFSVSVIALLLSVTGFNYWVDPFTYYHSPWTPINLSKNQRYANPGLARQLDYKVAVIGTSHVMDISSERLSEILETPTLNLPFTAGLIRESMEMTALVLKQEKANRVIIEMNYTSFSLGDVFHEPPLEFPSYLYTPRVEMPFRYLTSFDTLRHSLAALDEPGTITLQNKDYVGEFPFGESRVINIWNYQIAAWNEARIQFWQEFQTGIESPAVILERRLIPLVENYPHVQFDLFLSPNSILLYLQQESMGANDLSRWMDFRNLLGEYSQAYPNLVLHDLEADVETISNLELYRDMEHYNYDVLESMFRAMADGSAQVSSGEVVENSQTMYQAVLDYGRSFCARPDTSCNKVLMERF